MFKNSGKKIMGFVNFVFYLNLVLIILAMVGGGIYLFTEMGFSGQTILIALAALLAGFVYMLLVWLSLLALYAFGEMAQSTVDMKRMLAEMQASSTRPAPPVFREPARSRPEPPKPAPRQPEPAPFPVPPVQEAAPIQEEPTPAEPLPAPVNYEYKAPAGAPVIPVMNTAPKAAPTEGYRVGASNVVFCPKCFAKHDAGTPNCRYCGAELPSQGL